MSKKQLPKQLEWSIPEFPTHDRTAGWYVGASVIGLSLITYAIYSANFLFALIIFMAALIVFLFDTRTPSIIPIRFDGRGMMISEKMYPYKDVRSFWIAYDPPQVQALHILFQSSLKPRLAIPLEDQDPSTVRDFLKQYLDEKLDQGEEPLSDTIGRVLKI